MKFEIPVNLDPDALGEARPLDPAQSEPPLIKPWAILIHRTRPGKLINVHGVYHDAVGDRVAYHNVNSWGVRPSGARKELKRDKAAILTEYLTYRACRWDIDCLRQATFEVPINHEARRVEVCDRHVTEYLWWHNNRDPRSAMPDPDCWCPDSHLENGLEVRYCPTHGYLPDRGTNIDAFVNDDHFGITREEEPS